MVLMIIRRIWHTRHTIILYSLRKKYKRRSLSLRREYMTRQENEAKLNIPERWAPAWYGVTTMERPYLLHLAAYSIAPIRWRLSLATCEKHQGTEI